MSKESVEIGCIEESLECVYTALCEGCGVEISSNKDERSFAKEVHEKGWRVNSHGDLCCKDCIKKYP
jgi:hypothetical protein